MADPIDLEFAAGLNARVALERDANADGHDPSARHAVKPRYVPDNTFAPYENASGLNCVLNRVVSDANSQNEMVVDSLVYPVRQYKVLFASKVTISPPARLAWIDVDRQTVRYLTVAGNTSRAFQNGPYWQVDCVEYIDTSQA